MGSASNIFSGGSSAVPGSSKINSLGNMDTWHQINDPAGLGNKFRQEPPQPPDLIGAANAQGAQNIALAETMARLNNPNINNPLGSQNVTWNEDGTATINQTLNSGMQNILDSQMAIGGQLGQLGQSGLDRVGDAISQPFSHGGPAAVQGVQGGPLQTGLGNIGGPQTGLNMSGAPQLPISIQSVGQNQRGLDFSGAPTMPGQVSNAGQNIMQGLNLSGAPGMPAGIADVGGNQRSLSFSGLPEMPGAGGFSADRDRVESALMSRMEKQFGRDEEALRTRLAVQGIGPTTEAAKREFERLNEARTDARLQAILSAGSEQSRLFGLGMGARQQSVAEATAAANFANQAQQQAFQQAALRGDFGLDVRQQAVQEALQGGMFQNQAQQQGFQQQLMNNQFGLDLRQQGIQEALQGGQFANDAQREAFQQALQSGEFGMDARQQAFAEAMGGGQFSNAAQQQAFQQMLGSGQFANAAQAQQFAQALSGGNFQNLARQNAIQEAAFNRSLPLNELTALMSGAQVQMPNFQGFRPANADPAPIFNAAMGQGQQQMDLWNYNQQQRQGLQNGLFQLGGTAAMAYFMSDRRLKSNVELVGRHPLGIGIYEYDIFGERQRGVMADEVLTVMPEAVGEVAGYLTVDYGRLNAQ